MGRLRSLTRTKARLPDACGAGGKKLEAWRRRRDEDRAHRIGSSPESARINRDGATGSRREQAPTRPGDPKLL